jgi:hypothetical protein
MGNDFLAGRSDFCLPENKDMFQRGDPAALILWIRGGANNFPLGLGKIRYMAI